MMKSVKDRVPCSKCGVKKGEPCKGNPKTVCAVRMKDALLQRLEGV